MYAITPNKFLKNLSIVHVMLTFGVIAFSAVTLYINKAAFDFAFDTNDILVLIYPVIVVSALTLIGIVPKKILENAKKSNDLKTMLASYQTASIVKYILIEGSAMLGIVFYLLSKNGLFIVIALILIVFLILQRPTKNKVESDLELRGELRNQFQRYDEVID